MINQLWQRASLYLGDQYTNSKSTLIRSVYCNIALRGKQKKYWPNSYWKCKVKTENRVTWQRSTDPIGLVPNKKDQTNQETILANTRCSDVEDYILKKKNRTNSNMSV